MDFNQGYYDNEITFKFAIKNNTHKDIRGFMGVTIFYDIFDNVVKRVSLTIDARIKAGQTLTSDRVMNYNQFISEDVRFRDLKAEDLRMEFQPSQIVYTDGTKETFGGGN